VVTDNGQLTTDNGPGKDFSWTSKTTIIGHSPDKPMDGMIPAALGLGFVLGIRHVLDPDHVAAVSTIATQHNSIRRSSLVGTFWGLGHTASLLAVGLAVVVLKVSIPQSFALWMELGVAVMLVLLGVKALHQAVRGWTFHMHMHSHGGRKHIHLHFHRPEETHLHHHHHLLGFGARPFFVGVIHGLAGSAALMILVLATIPSTLGSLVFIAVFGLGSIGGMLILSSLISVPVVLTKKRFTFLTESLQVLAGTASVSFGAFLIWQYAFSHHLLF
jgi:ABC-type nickel/cobalt efflux system permease component RcnA